MEKISLKRVSTLVVLALSGIVLIYSSCKKNDVGKSAPVSTIAGQQFEWCNSCLF